MSLNLNLDVNEVNAVLAGLGELPAKTSYDLINKVKSQAEAQLNVAPNKVVEDFVPKQELLTE